MKIKKKIASKHDINTKTNANIATNIYYVMIENIEKSETLYETKYIINLICKNLLFPEPIANLSSQFEKSCSLATLSQ